MKQGPEVYLIKDRKIAKKSPAYLRTTSSTGLPLTFIKDGRVAVEHNQRRHAVRIVTGLLPVLHLVRFQAERWQHRPQLVGRRRAGAAAAAASCGGDGGGGRPSGGKHESRVK